MTDTIDVAALVERLRFLVSLNEPQKGGPYQGHAAQKFIEAADEAATALQSQADALAEARREISEASRYLDGLLRSYVGKYCYPVPEWQPLPDLIGMLTQIDNASTVTAQFEARANAAEASLATMRESLEEIERTDVVARYRGFGTTPDQYEVGHCAVIARAALAALAKEGK